MNERTNMDIHFSLPFLMALLCTLGLSGQGVVWVEGPASARQDRGFIGIYSGEMNRDKAEILGFENPYGSYVTRVIPGSGAEEAGLLPFDYIVGINEERVSRNNDLTDLLDAFEAGDEVTVHYIRGGRAMTTRATLGYRSSTGYTNLPESQQPFFGISPHDDNEDDELGVRVEVIGNSTAESVGLQTGDLILAINGHPMVDWTDIGTAVDNMVVGKLIEIRYERGGQEYTGKGSIRSRRETDRAIASARQQESAFIGIYSGQLSEEKAEKLGYDNPYGSYVTGIIPGTAADRAGLKPFDYLYGIDQYRVGEYQQLSHILRKYRAGDEATLHYFRRGQVQSTPITFGSRDDRDPEISRGPCEDPFLGVRHDFTSKDPEGIGITVVPNSTAADLGLEDGDIITHINDYPILDWEDLSIAVEQLKVGEPIKLSYRRGDNRLEGQQPVKSECETRGGPEEDAYGFDDTTWPDNGRQSPRRMLPDDMAMEIEDLSPSEADNLRNEHDIDMPTNQNLRIEGLNLAPNPSTGMFNLQFNLPNRGETSLQIFNAAGRLIYNYELGTFAGEFNDEVDISQNGTGSYFLLIRQDGRSVSKKIIISRR